MSEKVKLSKDGSSIDFVQSDSLPTSMKKFRQSPEIEGFYRFIFENDLQKEAYEILDRIIMERKAKKAAEKAANKAKEKEAAKAAKAAHDTKAKAPAPKAKEIAKAAPAKVAAKAPAKPAAKTAPAPAKKAAPAKAVVKVKATSKPVLKKKK
jgi:hypothetical protein